MFQFVNDGGGGGGRGGAGEAGRGGRGGVGSDKSFEPINMDSYRELSSDQRAQEKLQQELAMSKEANCPSVSVKRAAAWQELSWDDKNVALL